MEIATPEKTPGKNEISARYLTVKQAARYLSVHPVTVRRMAAAGLIQPTILPSPGRIRMFLRFDIKDLDRFMELRKEKL